MAGIDLQKFCDELRAKVSIVDVVGSKVKLVRKGREYQACCPFHNEKTPSFTVNEAKGFYHCFGCGAHGDIIKFEMEANNLPFMDAIRKLADKAGLQVPQISKESHEEAVKRNSLYDIMDGGGQVGRKLDFLIQEMNRESNTIASKANDIQIVKATIELKSEIEKIREQIQNLE